MRGYSRKPAILVATVASAVVLSGCVGISGTSTKQLGSLGSMQLTVSACANGAPSCSASANTESLYEFVNESPEDVNVQLLLAVRLPEGSTPPEKLVASIGGGLTLPFSRSSSYEAELQALEPAPAGERWWGWISDARTYSEKSPQSFGVTITTTLPRPGDGGPFESPMHWRPVVGGRINEPTNNLLASRPVKCGEDTGDLYNGYGEVGATNSVVCIDSPSQEATRGFLSAALTDFGIVGSNVQASPGSTVSAVFLAKRSGLADPPTVFSLAAQNGIPGGTVSIDRSSISLSGDSTQPVLATIGVPASTAPGAYPVTLTAAASNKPTRAGAVTVTIPGAAAGEKPSIRAASLSRKRFSRSANKSKSGKSSAPVGTKLRVELSEAAVLSIQVFRLTKKGAKKLGTHRRSLPKGQSTIAIRKRIGTVPLGLGKHRLTMVAEDADGQRSEPKQLTFTVVG